MKKPSIIVLAASMVLALAGLVAPAMADDAKPDPAHNAQNSLDWAGTYQGVLPCADCEGIKTTVVLLDDETYRMQSVYLGREGGPFTEEGQLTWNEAGDTITLDGPQPVRYFVGENQLFHLNLDGTRVTGELAEHYILAKQTDGVTEKYWKLVELNGQPVPTLEREPHMILKAEGGRVNGFSGCNSFSGSYKLDESTLRISFSNVASTMMACVSGMEVEQAFYKVLETVDNYSISGDHLTLNRARMAPLARFEAVYLH